MHPMKSILKLVCIAISMSVMQVATAQINKQKEVYTVLDETNLQKMLENLEIPFERVAKDDYKINVEGFHAFAEISEDGDLFLTSFFENKNVTLEQINGYNADHRWGRIYVDKDGDIAVQTELSFTGGIHLDGIIMHINTFTSILNSINLNF